MMRIKQLFPLIPVLALVALTSACEEESISGVRREEFRASFRSALQERIALQNGASSLVVEVKSIVDNRCHRGGPGCSGEELATVRVGVSSADKSSAETLLHIGTKEGNARDSVLVVLKERKYLLLLSNVYPFPGEVPAGEKQAELSVEERN
jgi:hypothetical protein